MTIYGGVTPPRLLTIPSALAAIRVRHAQRDEALVCTMQAQIREEKSQINATF